jgi:hypothetical protein
MKPSVRPIRRTRITTIEESANMAETARPISAQGSSGTTCRQSGPYRSTRNAQVIVFVKAGTAFPKDADNANTTWNLVT